MAGVYSRVMPGELITSDSINKILDALDSMENRVKQLESAAAGKRMAGKKKINLINK